MSILYLILAEMSIGNIRSKRVYVIYQQKMMRRKMHILHFPLDSGTNVCYKYIFDYYVFKSFRFFLVALCKSVSILSRSITQRFEPVKYFV